MANSKELQTQLQLQQQINSVLAARSKQFEAQQKLMSGQAQLAKELCNAMECKELDGLEDRIGNINNAFSSAATQAEKAGKSMEQAASAPNKDLDEQGSLLGNVLDKLTAGKVAAVTFGGTLVKALGGTMGMLRMVSSGVGTIVSGLMNVGKAIVSIPFKILNGFIDAAASGSGGINALRAALNDLKETMGDLATGEGKAVVTGFEELRGSSSALAKGGMSIGRIYGYGPDGAAAALKDVAAMAEAAGAQFSMLRDQIAKNASTMIMMNKGLGFSNEALTEMAAKAARTGSDVGDELVEMGSLAIQMGNKFGVSAKTIGKNMSVLTEDISNFGVLSRKELAATATFMAKLGLEAKDLQGVIDKFDDFEGAAESVSQLNQAFGIQLDTMDMMNAQNPAERIDQMRNAFFAAGKSVEDMTRQERKLLEAQTGLTGAALDNAFAIENQGIAYEDMEAAAEDAEANKMSEKEVMLELAKAIKEFIHGGDKVTGFFDAFQKGFSRGFAQNQAYRESIDAIRRSLQIMNKFGREVGKVFADIAKHLGLFDAIKRIFDPKAFSALLGMNGEKDGILTYIKKFRDSTKAGGEYSLGDMIKDIFERVKEYLLGPGADGAKAFSKFFENAIRFIGDGIASAIPVVLGMVTDLINALVGAIRDPSAMMEVTGSATEGIGGALKESFSKIGVALMEAWPELSAALGDLFEIVWEKVSPMIYEIGMKVILASIVKSTVVALGKAALMGGITKAAKFFAGKLGFTIGDQMNKETGKAMGEGGSGFFDGLGKMIGSISKIDTTAMFKAAGNLLILAGTFMIALLAFAGTIYLMHQMIGGIPWNELGKVFAVIGISVLAVVALALVSLFLEPVTMTTAAAFLGVSLLLLAAIGAYALGVRAVYEILKPVSFGEFIKSMGMVVLSVLAVAGLGAAGAAMASFIPAIPFMIVGLVAAAGLFAAGIAIFATAVMAIMPQLIELGTNADNIEKGLTALGQVVGAVAGMAALGAMFAAIGLFIGFLTRGFNKAADFLENVLDPISRMVNALTSIPMTNPDDIQKRISIISLIAETIQKMADIGLNAAKMGMVSELLGGTSMVDMFTSMGGFIAQIGDTLGVLVRQMVRAAKGIKPDELKGVEAIAKVMAAIGSLMGALAAPLETIAQLHGQSGIIMKDDITDIVSAVMDGMGSLMETLGDNIEDIVDSIQFAAEGITNPEQMNKQMDVIVKMFDVLGKFAKALTDSSGLIELTSNDGAFWTGRDTATRVSEIGGAIENLLTPLKRQMKKLVKHFKTMAADITDPEALLPKMDVAIRMFEVLASFAKSLKDMKGTFGSDDGLDVDGVNSMMTSVGAITKSLFAAEGEGSIVSISATLGAANITAGAEEALSAGTDILSGLGSFYESLTAVTAIAATTPATGLGAQVKMIVDEVNQSIEALNSIGDVNADVALRNFAAAVGVSSETLTINNPGVNITMNVSVSMDADKVGKVLIDKSVMTTPLATAEG